MTRPVHPTLTWDIEQVVTFSVGYLYAVAHRYDLLVEPSWRHIRSGANLALSRSCS